MSNLTDPATVSAAALMALESQAMQPRGMRALAERPGTVSIRKRGRGQEIREIRLFADGDDPRHLDAAATARTGTLQTRTFQEDREQTVILIADFRRPMLWGTRGRFRSVAAAEALALIGWQIVLEGGAVGVVALTDDGVFVERPRTRHRGMALVAGCLERAHAAALRSTAPTTALSPALLRAAPLAPRGARIALATGLDDLGDGWDAALAALTARGKLHLILTEDRFESAPPPQALSYATPAGRARAHFSGLADQRSARADVLLRPGVTVERLPTDQGLR